MKHLMKNQFFPIFALILAISFFMGFLGCGGGGPKSKKPPGPKKSDGNAQIKAVAPTEPEKPQKIEKKVAYSYNPVGKRDPFEVFVLTDALHPDVPLTPLQRYSIDQLALIGIVWGISNPHAMVQDPNGKGHVLKRGTLVGKNWGKVTRIKPDEVIISEEFRDIDGRLVVNEISLKLPKPERLEE